jgi:glycosyltransferase involved in cell wall biosynthesis
VKVSALIPTYNRREHVFRAIDSVLAQTSPVDEIIVVDDGSTDGSAEAVRSFYGSRVTLIQQKNSGVSAARNRGIREARGEWIAFLDSDDVWFPTKLERQFEALAALGEGFGMCFTDCVYSGDEALNRSVFQEMGFESAPEFGAVEEPAKYMLEKREPFLFPSSMLIRRSLLSGNDAFDESLVVRLGNPNDLSHPKWLSLGEDTDVVFRLGFRTRFCYATEPLVEIDRAPSRPVGLLTLYDTRDDRKFEALERRYAKWLALSSVTGTEYEQPVRQMLRETYYDSIATKVRDFRIGPAFREMNRLRAVGDGFVSIIGTLISNRIGKLRHRSESAAATPPALSQNGEAGDRS